MISLINYDSSEVAVRIYPEYMEYSINFKYSCIYIFPFNFMGIFLMDFTDPTPFKSENHLHPTAQISSAFTSMTILRQTSIAGRHGDRAKRLP